MEVVKGDEGVVSNKKGIYSGKQGDWVERYSPNHVAIQNIFLFAMPSFRGFCMLGLPLFSVLPFLY